MSQRRFVYRSHVGKLVEGHPQLQLEKNYNTMVSEGMGGRRRQPSLPTCNIYILADTRFLRKQVLVVYSADM